MVILKIFFFYFKFLFAVHYPSFIYHLDDSKKLSSRDYIYVYTLFMHFACVKIPNPHFHSSCTKLSAAHQSIVAEFLNTLLNNDDFSHAKIRSAVAKCCK